MQEMMQLLLHVSPCFTIPVFFIYRVTGEKGLEDASPIYNRCETWPSIVLSLIDWISGLVVVCTKLLYFGMT